MTTAALGGEFEVPTLDGARAKVKVAPGTQPGQRVRLKGKGMPVLRSKDVGDLYVQLDVETPQNLSQPPARAARGVREGLDQGQQPDLGRLLRQAQEPVRGEVGALVARVADDEAGSPRMR